MKRLTLLVLTLVFTGCTVTTTADPDLMELVEKQDAAIDACRETLQMSAENTDRLLAERSFDSLPETHPDTQMLKYISERCHVSKSGEWLVCSTDDCWTTPDETRLCNEIRVFLKGKTEN